MPGEEPVVGGGGTVICCWASALPDSNANPSAAIADNLITMKASQIDIAIPQSLPLQIPLKEWGRRKGGTDGKGPSRVHGRGKLAERLEVEFGPFRSALSRRAEMLVSCSNPVQRLVRLRQRIVG